MLSHRASDFSILLLPHRLRFGERFAVFGMDVHRDLLVTTVKTEEGEETRYSGVSMEDLNSLMEWLREKKCRKGVMESSGIYWVPTYMVLTDNGFEVTLANAHQVKAIPGRKTDELDSQWLARVFSAGLIKPSYMPEKKIRELMFRWRSDARSSVRL